MEVLIFYADKLMWICNSKDVHVFNFAILLKSRKLMRTKCTCFTVIFGLCVCTSVCLSVCLSLCLCVSLCVCVSVCGPAFSQLTLEDVDSVSEFGDSSPRRDVCVCLYVSVCLCVVQRSLS